jgi:hypothetical protein
MPSLEQEPRKRHKEEEVKKKVEVEGKQRVAQGEVSKRQKEVLSRRWKKRRSGNEKLGRVKNWGM